MVNDTLPEAYVKVLCESVTVRSARGETKNVATVIPFTVQSLASGVPVKLTSVQLPVAFRSCEGKVALNIPVCARSGSRLRGWLDGKSFGSHSRRPEALGA